MKLAHFSLLLFLSIPCIASSLLVDKLKNKGFSCTSFADGDLCQVQSVNSAQFTYSKPIGIYVPKNIRHPGEILLHLHGHLGICEVPPTQSPTVDLMMNTYQFPQQMQTAGDTSSVLILPLSEDRCKTFETELALHFYEFMNWVNLTVEPSNHDWIISGHSGAGRTLGTIMKYGAQGSNWFKRIRATILLDATYNSDDLYFQRWQGALKFNPQMKVFNVYIPGSATEAGSQKLKSTVPSLVEIQSKYSHCNIPKKYYSDLLKQAELK